jgi:hypothetical protein
MWCALLDSEHMESSSTTSCGEYPWHFTRLRSITPQTLTDDFVHSVSKSTNFHSKKCLPVYAGSIAPILCTNESGAGHISIDTNSKSLRSSETWITQQADPSVLCVCVSANSHSSRSSNKDNGDYLLECHGRRFDLRGCAPQRPDHQKQRWSSTKGALVDGALCVAGSSPGFGAGIRSESKQEQCHA